MQDTANEHTPMTWFAFIGTVAAGVVIFGLICVLMYGLQDDAFRHRKIVSAWRKHLIENGATAELVNSIEHFDIPREFRDKVNAALNR